MSKVVEALPSMCAKGVSCAYASSSFLHYMDAQIALRVAQ